MLDRLLEGKPPEKVVGQSGLLEDLTKRLLEHAPEGDLTEHLGYDRHTTEGCYREGNVRASTGAERPAPAARLRQEGDRVARTGVCLDAIRVKTRTSGHVQT